MRERKHKLIFGSWVTALSVILLTTATYAWMSISSTLTVSNLELNVVTENAMEIALDAGGEPGEWTTLLSLGELLGSELTLLPATWSAQYGNFCKVNYGLDGRPDGLQELDTSARTAIYTPENPEDPTSAEAEAGGGAGGTGYLIALDLWLRTGSSGVQVYLSEPALREAENLGTGTWVVGEPVWDAGAVRHHNGGNNAEKAMRIALRTYDEEYDTGGFVIYEPNVEDGEAPTVTADGTVLRKLIRQGQTTWTEQDPVLRDSLNYQMGEFMEEDTNLFRLVGNTPRRFTLFIWLEGQDKDCTNSITAGKVLMNLQFAGTTDLHTENIYRPADGDPQATEPTEETTAATAAP